MKPSERIDQLIAGLSDWRGKTLAKVRKVILEADREIIEEWKWMGSPAWSRDGMIAVGNAHKDKVKLTFSNGARLPDPDKLFNAGLGGGQWRALDLFEGGRLAPGTLARPFLRQVATLLQTDGVLTVNLMRTARLPEQLHRLESVFTIERQLRIWGNAVVHLSIPAAP